MKEDDLVRLMDAYMGCEGFYMKPKIEEDGRNSFFIAKDMAKSSDVDASFELVKEAIGTKEDKEYHSNNRKNIGEGFIGAGIGIAVSIIVGCIIAVSN